MGGIGVSEGGMGEGVGGIGEAVRVIVLEGVRLAEGVMEGALEGIAVGEKSALVIPSVFIGMGSFWFVIVTSALGSASIPQP